jgi:aspartyl protease family protein
MRNVLILAALGIVVSGAAGKLLNRFDGTRPAVRQASIAVPAPTPTGSPETVVVPRGRDGHFHVDAVVGGKQVPFMVDTGASLIALSSAEAQRLGITPGRRDGVVRMQTANGIVNATRARLSSVTIGQLTIYDVDAVVMPSGALGQNLLGLSFLSRLRRFEFRSGQLVLEQ